MRIKNFIILTTAIYLCGSCSSEDTISNSNQQSQETSTNNYTDAQLIEMVQKDALKYFWDYAESGSNWQENDIIPIILLRMQIL
jgi:hypothetical protein